MQIRKTFVTRELAGEKYLIPIGDINCSLIALSETAAFIWDLLPQAEDAAYIVTKMLEEYEIDEATAMADTEEFLNTLRKLDII